LILRAEVKEESYGVTQLVLHRAEVKEESYGVTQMTDTEGRGQGRVIWCHKDS
jgi:hypothetical protein